MELVIADASGRDLREVADFEMDMAYGSDENAVKVSLDASAAPRPGQYVYVDGTDLGGTIDSVTSSASSPGALACAGRTWHGVLAGKVLMPDGERLHVEGCVGEVIADLMSRTGLAPFFRALPNDVYVNWEFERFCDAYSGICTMLASIGRKLTLTWSAGAVLVGAPEARSASMPIDGESADLSVTRNVRRVNHLVCGGIGQGEQREVVHFYADSSGRVSHAQTLFGVDEIAAFYDYTNADEDKLESEGAKKLAEYQSEGLVEGQLHAADLDVGDEVECLDADAGLSVRAVVAKKVVKVSRGVAVASYEIGEASTTVRSASKVAEGSSGSEYTAGTAITIDKNSINVDLVDETDVPSWF